MNKILVIGGMHGNEPLGIGLVKLLTRKPLPEVDAVLANKKAIEKNVRFTEADLNRSFPGSRNGNYEERRAAELIKVCSGYDYVLDFHNTHCPDNDCGFVGSNKFPKMLPIAAYLKLSRVVIADYDCINKYVPSCISVEVSLSSERNSVLEWYQWIRRLSSANLDDFSLLLRPKLYRFAYRVSNQEWKQYGFKNWRAFQPLIQTDAAKLGFQEKVYPIFVKDAYTPYNSGGLVADFNQKDLQVS